jgi:phenylalanyl-tRNA synthetase alpha chain
MDLHPHEVKVLKALKRQSSPREVADAAHLEFDAVLRAASWLKTKGLIDVLEEVSEEVTLGDEGRAYVKAGLPERQVLAALKDGMTVEELKGKVSPEVFSIGFGWLRKKKCIEVDGGKIRILDSEETSDESVLGLLAKGAINSRRLDAKGLAGLAQLKSRKSVVEVKEAKSITLKPTQEGLRLASEVSEDERLSQLTPEMLVNKSWQGKNFRPYDTSAYVRAQTPVKKHPLRRQINKVRRIFTNMGFSEIKGPLVESAFWNFDALFQPQDHPARDMHDTFYLKRPKTVPIEGFERYKENVRLTHEGGWTTGSTGWRYKWDEEVAKKTLLRTHTTAVTVRHLSGIKKEDLPVKVFSIGKVFRNEAIDYKHLPEFYQVEGIVVDPNANFRNLLGILKQFYTEMGFDKVRFRPGYFPYTEMSIEPEVYLEGKGWIELGGSGIFRPEVVKPILGFECPVLAWGLGLDRIVTLGLGLTDIRELYMSDMDWLKEN